MAKSKDKKRKKDKPAKGVDLTATVIDDPPEPMYRADLSRPERILLALAWARSTGSVVVAGQAYRTKGGWTDGWLLAHRSIGGTSADVRLRELRRAGRVERRNVIADDGQWIAEYRIVPS